MGLSPHMSSADAFRALVRDINGMDREFKGNVATEYGTFHEDGARFEYEMETGNSVNHIGFAPVGAWLGASPDGLVGDSGLVEIKCPYGQREKNPPKFKSVHDQPHYYAQAQIQMVCTGRNWCDLFQWSPHGTMLERVYFDQDWIGENFPKLYQFWKDANAANPEDHDGERRKEIDTPDAARLVREYDDLSEAIDNATARKKEVLAEIVRLAGEHNSIVAGRNLTHIEKAGAVSYAKALKAYAPDADLEPYRSKPSDYWVLK